jgi:hypothetical protein
VAPGRQSLPSPVSKLAWKGSPCFPFYTSTFLSKP